MQQTQIIILDFGSQYTQLLARRIREQNILAEVIDFNISKAELTKYPNLKGIILSGGPASVYEEEAYTVEKELLEAGFPVLGVCYGLQLITHLFGGTVEAADQQEFGKAKLVIDVSDNALFENIPNRRNVWMSHADHITQLPKDFHQIAHSDNSIAAIKHDSKEIYGIQFHAEVTHSEFGAEMINNFLFKIAKAEKDWYMATYIEKAVKDIQAKVGTDKVILGLSGGVDSSVAAALISKAIGKQLTCIFVDTGLLRKNEGLQVMETYAKNFDINIKMIDASELFYKNLRGISEPEAKRKMIGKLFIEVFTDEARKLSRDAKWLAQGTIYSDVIESSKQGHSSKTIKSHHNVGGLPDDLNFELLEPLRDLFKDEVRKVGRELGIPDKMIDRHPFPGPGLGIRVIGEVTKTKCDILREVDDIFISTLHEANLYTKVQQAHVVLLPVKTVGVMGDNRTYEYVAALRCVNTVDFMTATASHLPWEFIDKVVNKIINEVKNVNRIVYDVTSKPPGTIEWE